MRISGSTVGRERHVTGPRPHMEQDKVSIRGSVDAVATDHRPDLAATGMGNGNCGYSITFYRESNPRYLPFVAVKVDGGDIELPRAGQFGFGEFITAFYQTDPAGAASRAGRADRPMPTSSWRAARQGLMARHAVPGGAIAIVGPGTICRLRCAGDATGVKLYCVPLRATPVTMANDGGRNEIMRQSGVRL